MNQSTVHETKGAIIAAVQEKAAELIQLAELGGVVVTIELKPLEPLAMGNHKMVAEVVPRHPY